MNETKNKINELYKQIRELKEQLKKEKPNDGIPVEGGDWSIFIDGSVGFPLVKTNGIKKALNQFSSAESAKKHSEMMTTWRQELVDSKRGKPVNIDVLLPFLKKGFVAMDKDGKWFWYKHEPIFVASRSHWGSSDASFERLLGFNLKPASDWRDSLKKCGL